MRSLFFQNTDTYIKLLVMTGLLIFGGCASKGPPNMFVLDSQAPTLLPTFESGFVVGLGPVNVAPYLDRNQIVTNKTANKLELSEQNQWAEPLKDGFARVLLVNLAVSLKSNQVYILPMRKRRIMDLEVPVDILRFDGELGRRVNVVARWSLVDGSTAQTLHTHVSIIQQPVSKDGYESFVAAQSRAIVQLGKDISTAINQYIGTSYKQ